MKKSRIFKNTLVVLIILVSSSCKPKFDHDSEAFGKSFCECMKQNGSPKEYLYALTVCDGRLIRQSRLYRMYRVDIRFGEQDRKLSGESRDSANRFIKILNDYTEKNCCNLVLSCPYDTVKEK